MNKIACLRTSLLVAALTCGNPLAAATGHPPPVSDADALVHYLLDYRANTGIAPSDPMAPAADQQAWDYFVKNTNQFELAIRSSIVYPQTATTSGLADSDLRALRYLPLLGEATHREVLREAMDRFQTLLDEALINHRANALAWDLSEHVIGSPTRLKLAESAQVVSELYAWEVELYRRASEHGFDLFVDDALTTLQGDDRTKTHAGIAALDYVMPFARKDAELAARVISIGTTGRAKERQQESSVVLRQLNTAINEATDELLSKLADPVP